MTYKSGFSFRRMSSMDFQNGLILKDLNRFYSWWGAFSPHHGLLRVRSRHVMPLNRLPGISTQHPPIRERTPQAWIKVLNRKSCEGSDRLERQWVKLNIELRFLYFNFYIFSYFPNLIGFFAKAHKNFSSGFRNLDLLMISNYWPRSHLLLLKLAY